MGQSRVLQLAADMSFANRNRWCRYALVLCHNLSLLRAACLPNIAWKLFAYCADHRFWGTHRIAIFCDYLSYYMMQGFKRCNEERGTSFSLLYYERFLFFPNMLYFVGKVIDKSVTFHIFLKWQFLKNSFCTILKER